MKQKPTPGMLRKIAGMFAALADENRLRIMLSLRERACTVGELAAELGIAQPSVSKHLGVLRREGLVETRRDGTMTVVSIADETIFAICEQVCGVVVRRQANEFVDLGFRAPQPPRVQFASPSRPARANRKPEEK